MKDIGDKPALTKGLYQHFKGGMYKVIDVVCHSETQEWYVVYESQKRKAEGLSSLWVRPYEMFVEEVTRNGETFPRFKKLNDTQTDETTS